MMMATETAKDNADTRLCGPVTENEIGSYDILFDGFYTLQYKFFSNASEERVLSLFRMGDLFRKALK
jgi:hypothetical protein